MHYRKSPLAKTPPADFPAIPGVTAPGVQETIAEGDEDAESPKSPPKPSESPKLAPAAGGDEDDVFAMDQ